MGTIQPIYCIRRNLDTKLGLAQITLTYREFGVARSLVFSVNPLTWARMQKGDWFGKLNRTQLTRVSALIVFYKALHLYFIDDLADQWPGLRNSGPLFGGRDPVEAMVNGGLPTMLDARNYVDALRGSA